MRDRHEPQHMNNMASHYHCRHQGRLCYGRLMKGFSIAFLIILLLHDNIFYHVLATSTSPLKKHAQPSITFVGSDKSRIIRSSHQSLTRRKSQSRCCSCCFSTFSPRRFSGVSSSSSSQRYRPSTTAATTLFIRRRSIPIPRASPSQFCKHDGDHHVDDTAILSRVLHQRGGGGGGYYNRVPTAMFMSAAAAVTADEEATAATSSSNIINNNNSGKINLQNGENIICNNDNNNNDEENEEEEEEKEEEPILIHTYNFTMPTNTTPPSLSLDGSTLTSTTTCILMGLGIPKRQFATWVQYHLSSKNCFVSVVNEKGDASSSSECTNTSNSSETEIIATSAPSTNKKKRIEIDKIMNDTTTERVYWHEDTETCKWDDRISTIRTHWKNEQLLCEHTNLLHDGIRFKKKKIKTKKEGDDKNDDNEEDESLRLKKQQQQEEEEEEERQMKYEHFKNTLGSYADRLVDMVKDELSDSSFFPSSPHDNHHPDKEQLNELQEQHDDEGLLQPILRWETQSGLRGWIEKEYGLDNTNALLAETLLDKSEREQIETFQSFLDFFRDKFPYFHDACDNCGASCNHDPLSEGKDGDEKEAEDAATTMEGSDNIEEKIDIDVGSTDVDNKEDTLGDMVDDDDDEDNDNFSFVGYVAPSQSERLGNASRTELYRCRSCSAFTRFPRYNKALFVTQTRRGRCGEYSMLLYRMLRALGYKRIRWVVDWADHVWVEAFLGDDIIGVVSDNDSFPDKGNEKKKKKRGRWVHLDPCEAAIDNQLLYSSWGKNQTYLVAFYDPLLSSETTTSAMLVDGDNDDCNGKDVLSSMTSSPVVEDVTLRYTSDKIDVVTKRRGISEQSVAKAINEVSKKMVSMLTDVVTQK